MASRCFGSKTAAQSKVAYTDADIGPDARSLDGMSRVQEICNAISMMTPAAVAMICWTDPPGWFTRGPRTVLLLTGLLLHLPFSVMYHMSLSLRALEDAVDNLPRRLDQGFIHICCVTTAWALSQNLTYALLCTLANLYFMFRLWFRSPSTVERMINIGIGTFLYGIAGLMHGHLREFLCGTTWFVFGTVAMLVRLGGWGHSAMHVCLGGLTYYILVSVCRLQLDELKQPGNELKQLCDTANASDVGPAAVAAAWSCLLASPWDGASVWDW